jgi:hypothetical protein
MLAFRDLRGPTIGRDLQDHGLCFDLAMKPA